MTVATSRRLRPASLSASKRAATNCPCSIWPASTVSRRSSTENDPSAVELGVKFRSDVDGYVTALRFYKSLQDVGPHVGHFWSADGTLLASANFAGESASGWQEVALPSPVAVTKDTTYVASYHTASGNYTVSAGFFALNGVDNGPLHALRDGIDGPNGVYRYGASAFPSETYAASNYWVDVVLATSLAPDTTPPAVSQVSPASGASGVAAGTAVSAVFNENLSAASVTTASFELSGPDGGIVPASATYTAGTRTAQLSPTASLAYSTLYTARLIGGTSGIHDVAGNALASTVTWTFTTGAAPPPPPAEGPGGPILVIGHSANPFSRYYAEILRAEGLNAFRAMDITAVSPATLASYQVAILGEMPLTPTQVAMFSDWVTAGGNLIAMRPDKQLAVLLGVADAGSVRANAYLLVNTTTAPGAGITGESLQYHGLADRYTLDGATTVATLFADGTTPTLNPAVTVRSIGSNGGQAAAFSFDLARSIVYTRQGNPGLVRPGARRPVANPVERPVLRWRGARLGRLDEGRGAAGRRAAAIARQLDRARQRRSDAAASLLVLPTRREGYRRDDRRRSRQRRYRRPLRRLPRPESVGLQRRRLAVHPCDLVHLPVDADHGRPGRRLPRRRASRSPRTSVLAAPTTRRHRSIQTTSTIWRSSR